MATRADVARMAGVSETAVSYALSGKRSISEETRARIFEAVSALCYQPNAMARALAGTRTALIALLIPTEPQTISGGMRYAIGAAEAAHDAGHQLMLIPIVGDSVDEIVALHRSGLVDGALLVDVRREDARVNALVRAAVPIGVIGRTEEHPDLPWADRDYSTIVDDAVAHLLRQGHRELVFVNGPQIPTMPETTGERLAADVFHAACMSRGLTSRTIWASKTVEAGRSIFDAHLTDPDGVTGVVSLNSEASIGILAAANAAGTPIPTQLSLICLDTPEELAGMTSPAMTTISPPTRQVGSAAMHLLVNHLDTTIGSDVQQLWAGEITVRGTTGRRRRTPPQAKKVGV